MSWWRREERGKKERKKKTVLNDVLFLSIGMSVGGRGEERGGIFFIFFLFFYL